MNKIANLQTHTKYETLTELNYNGPVSRITKFPIFFSKNARELRFIILGRKMGQEPFTTHTTLFDWLHPHSHYLLTFMFQCWRRPMFKKKRNEIKVCNACRGGGKPRATMATALGVGPFYLHCSTLFQRGPINLPKWAHWVALGVGPAQLRHCLHVAA